MCPEQRVCRKNGTANQTPKPAERQEEAERISKSQQPTDPRPRKSAAIGDSRAPTQQTTRVWLRLRPLTPTDPPKLAKSPQENPTKLPDPRYPPPGHSLGAVRPRPAHPPSPPFRRSHPGTPPLASSPPPPVSSLPKAARTPRRPPRWPRPSSTPPPPRSRAPPSRAPPPFTPSRPPRPFASRAPRSRPAAASRFRSGRTRPVTVSPGGEHPGTAASSPP